MAPSFRADTRRSGRRTTTGKVAAALGASAEVDAELAMSKFRRREAVVAAAVPVGVGAEVASLCRQRSTRRSMRRRSEGPAAGRPGRALSRSQTAQCWRRAAQQHKVRTTASRKKWLSVDAAPPALSPLAPLSEPPLLSPLSEVRSSEAALPSQEQTAGVGRRWHGRQQRGVSSETVEKGR